MISRFIILAFIVFNFFANACNRPSSNSNSLKTLSRDTTIVDSLNDLAFSEMHIDLEKARDYADTALNISDSLGYLSGKASAYMRFGSFFMLEGAYWKADSLFQKALILRKDIGFKPDIAGTYNNIGLNQSYQGNDLEAVKNYQEGLKVLGEQNQTQKAAMLFNNLGESYMYLGKYEEAARCINEGVSIRKELGDEIGMANSLLNLGGWYFEIGSYEKAISVLDSSLALFKKHKDEYKQAKSLISLGITKYRLGQPKAALIDFDMALKNERLLEKIEIASVFRNKGVIYRSLNLPYQAQSALSKSLDLFTETENVPGIASIKYNIGLLYKDKSEYRTALSHFQSCKDILGSVNEPLLYMELVREMSETYALLDQTDSAFYYSLKHNELQDSLDTSYREAMNYKVNYEEEQKKTAILEKENLLKTSENNHKKLIIKSIAALSVLGGFLLGTIIWALLVSRRKREAEQEVDTLLNNQEIQMAYAKLEGQDEERKRIAQDLHDRMGSILSAIKFYLEGFDKKLDAMKVVKQDHPNNKANELLDQAFSEVRRISQDIHSSTLAKFGLKAELDALANLLKDSNRIKVEVVTHGLEDRLPVALESKLYRIIQELVSNVLKHAQASKVTIQVNQFKDVINMIIEDNGKGFVFENTKKKGGMGLSNVEARVHDLHGTFIVDSGKNNGTSITIDIPNEG